MLITKQGVVLILIVEKLSKGQFLTAHICLKDQYQFLLMMMGARNKKTTTSISL